MRLAVVERVAQSQAAAHRHLHQPVREGVDVHLLSNLAQQHSQTIGGVGAQHVRPPRERRDHESAIDSLKKADKQDGGHRNACADGMVRYGLKIGDFKDADAGAQQLIADAKDPQHAALAHRRRATVQLRQGFSRNKEADFVLADREYQADLAVAPDDVDALFYDGLALAHLNRDDVARDRFQRLLAVAPKDSVVRLRAERYLQEPDLARARMAPAFTFTSLNGEQVSLDGLAGKVVLIDFWRRDVDRAARRCRTSSRSRKDSAASR